jgi:hypothetical protein
MPKVVHQIFYKSLVSLLGVVALAVFLLMREGQGKAGFSSITSIEKTYGRFPAERDVGKYRYLQLHNYPMAFSLFIGKDPGDFSPKLEIIDELKPGDIVTVYFEEQVDEGDHINRLAYFIDMGSEAVFIKGDGTKLMIYVLIGICMATIVLLLVLKRLGKIA